MTAAFRESLPPSRLSIAVSKSLKTKRINNRFRRKPARCDLAGYEDLNDAQRLSLVTHARYDWLLLAESHLTRRLFGSMLQRIWALPVPTGRRGSCR